MTEKFFNPIEQNAEYIFIPGGEYRFSVTGKIVQVPDLYFAKYPVTNKLYNVFLDSSPQKKQDKHRSCYADNKRFGGDDQPVVGVNWHSATAYCERLTEQSAKSGGQYEKAIFRLPNEEEREWAASGGKREFPWGNEAPNDARANYERKVGHTTPVGAYPAGATPDGLMDMAGNVWEWCENLYGEGTYALRGGSWVVRTDVLRCASRVVDLPGDRGNNVGFRVVCAASHF